MEHSLSKLAVSDTGFVFDPRTGQTYSVNATGLVVLRGLKEGRPLEDIRAELDTNFEQASGVDDHVRQFVQLLADFGLVPESERVR